MKHVSGKCILSSEWQFEFMTGVGGLSGVGIGGSNGKEPEVAKWKLDEIMWRKHLGHPWYLQLLSKCFLFLPFLLLPLFLLTLTETAHWVENWGVEPNQGWSASVEAPPCWNQERWEWKWCCWNWPEQGKQGSLRNLLALCVLGNGLRKKHPSHMS